MCKEDSFLVASLVDLSKCRNDLDFLNKIAYIVDGTCESCGHYISSIEELEAALIGSEGTGNARESR